MDELSTQEKLLKIGKEEFISKSYKDASLRSIVEKAGFTLGAFYGYYKSKAALFSALVEPSAEILKNRFMTAIREQSEQPDEERFDLSFQHSSNAYKEMIDFIYDHFDAFRLLVCHSAGTPYEEYIESLAQLETAATVEFSQDLQTRGYTTKTISSETIHMLSRAFVTAVFEVVAHNVKKEEAEQHLMDILIFYRAGWAALFCANE